MNIYNTYYVLFFSNFIVEENHAHETNVISLFVLDRVQSFHFCGDFGPLVVGHGQWLPERSCGRDAWFLGWDETAGLERLEASVCPGESYADVLWIQVLCARPMSGFKGFQCCWALDFNPSDVKMFHWDWPHRSFGGRSGTWGFDRIGTQLFSWWYCGSLHPLVKRNFSLIRTHRTDLWESILFEENLPLGMSQPPFCNAFATCDLSNNSKQLYISLLLVVFSHLIFLGLEA